MKKYFAVFMMLAAGNVFAEDSGLDPALERVTLWGSAGTGALGFSVHQLVTAERLRNSETQVILDPEAGARVLSESELDKLIARTQSGDELRVSYHLNPTKNRALVIERLEDEILTHDSNAGEFQRRARTALARTKEVKERDGTVRLVADPDHLAHLNLMKKMEAETKLAQEKSERLTAIRAGGPVEFIDRFSTVDTRSGVTSHQALKALTDDGAKLKSVARIPQSAVEESSRKVRRGYAGLGVAAVSVLAAAGSGLSGGAVEREKNARISDVVGAKDADCGESAADAADLAAATGSAK